MKRSSPIIAIASLVASCTFTTTKNADLNPSGKEVLSQIKASYRFEEVNALGTSRSGAEKGDYLTLQLINGQNLPASSRLSALGESFAGAVVQALDTPHHYESIKVEFTRRKGNSLSNTTESTSFDFRINQQRR